MTRLENVARGDADEASRSSLRVRGLWSLALLAALALSASASAQAPDDLPAPQTEAVPAPDAIDPALANERLARRLLTVAVEEAGVAIEAYHAVVGIVEEGGADAQSRARQRVLEGALAAERAEVTMRIRFAMLGGVPSDDEGQFRLLLTFLAAAADDLLEVDAIDAEALRANLPELTTPIQDLRERLADVPVSGSRALEAP